MSEGPRRSAAEGDVAAALVRLDEITRRLRRECPWDREQDERSIVPHTVEEAYELADAAASGDDAKLLDELGDVLFQVHFLALLLEERGAGNLADVPENLPALLYARKMQRRAASASLRGEEAQERLSDSDLRDEAERWVGETLFALVDVARRMRVDPELALRAAAQRFRDEAHT